MMRSSLCARISSLAAALLILTLGSASVVGQELTASKWSSDVWQLARNGDRAALERHFEAIPAEGVNPHRVDRFRESLQVHLANVDRAEIKRGEERQKSLEDLQKHVNAGSLPQALRAAVTLQSLADDLDDAFEDADVLHVVGWAKERVSQAEQEGDWLLAQELLFYLRTLYEDTTQLEQYREAKEELDAVNRRVSLLAQYAPRRLHELRVKRALRLDEEPPPEYQPRARADWQDRIRGIGPELLKAALRTAAEEHIESNGWKPLLRGGLKELRLIATTPSLEEAFPQLANKDAVREWVGHLDKELAVVEKADPRDLSGYRLTTILGELLQVNERTVKLDKGVLYREFGDGAMYDLDEYSEIIWPDKLARFRQATEGAFVGVGIIIRHNETQEIIVVNPLEGTPAYFGGVKPNDVIVEVDQESTVGWSLNDAVDRITGPKATKVTLGVQRAGVDGLIPIPLTRDVIKLPSVMGWWKHTLTDDGTPVWDWYVDPVSRIAYIRLAQFTDETHSDLVKAWREMSADGKPSGIILDLRYNPGGLLSSAVQISNLFVKNGVIVTGENKDGAQAWNPQRADPTRSTIADAKVPVVVLINQGSASASEIVAGCLQAHGAAVVLGERSFGKGSVQTVHTTTDKARLKLTTQYYRLPAKAGEALGRLVHRKTDATVWGVDPDIIVKMTPKQYGEALELRQTADVIEQDAEGNLIDDPAKRPDVNRLLSEGLDPQLETALLILQARALSSSTLEQRHARAE